MDVSGILEILPQVYPHTCRFFPPLDLRKLAEAFARETQAAWPDHRFSVFLSRKRLAHPFLADLALLDWKIWQCYGRSTLPLSGFEGVSAAREPDWFGARFRFDPAHYVMESDWPLEEIVDGKSEVQRRPGLYLIYRRQEQPTFRRLGLNEARLLEPLSLGVPLGHVLDKPNGPDFDARLFQEWVDSGLLRSIQWAAV